MTNATGILIGLGYALVCIAVVHLIAGAVVPVSQERATRAVGHLPETYRLIALREMDATRRAGIVVTRRKLRFIVRCIERLAREHGAIA